jgi:hypothetical protein
MQKSEKQQEYPNNSSVPEKWQFNNSGANQNLKQNQNQGYHSKPNKHRSAQYNVGV